MPGTTMMTTSTTIQAASPGRDDFARGDDFWEESDCRVMCFWRNDTANRARLLTGRNRCASIISLENPRIGSWMVSPDTVIYHSRIRLLILVLVSLTFLGIGLLMIGAFGNALLTGRSPFLLIKLQFGAFVAGGALFAAIGGGCLLFYMRRLVSRRPCLIIGDHGIVDNVSWLPAGHISWSEIKGMRIVNTAVRFSTQESLVIELTAPAAVFPRQSTAKRRLMRLCFRGGERTAVTIPRSVLPMSLAELIKLIDSRRPSAQAQAT